MEKHVFIAALSVFGRERSPGVTQMRDSVYQFEDKSQEKSEQIYTYRGYYQLEPIPMFIKEKLHETITDIVLLETPDTYAAKKDGRMQVWPAPDYAEWPVSAADIRVRKAEEAGPITAAAWYKEWLNCRFPSAKIHEIHIRESSPHISLEKTLKKIRELYSEVDTPDEWRLWIDTHGGFRDLAVVLATAARMFAVGKDSIRTDGIFSIYFSQNNTPSEIVNLTPFYFTQSSKALKHYLNYGQYLTLEFNPCEGKEPYAFISYRHDKSFLVAVRAMFSQMKQNGIRFWFDDGIHAWESWEKTLAKKNDEARAFFGLITGSYFESAECWKELIRAIAAAKEGQKQIFFAFLEEGLSLPTAVPQAEKYASVQTLMQELNVTQEDLPVYMNTEIQQIQAYRYLPGNDESNINERKLSDAMLAEALGTVCRVLSDAKWQ